MQMVGNEEWEQLQSLFHLVADAPADEMETVLAQASPSEKLREQVRSIVLAERSASIGPDRLPESDSVPAERRFRGYKVLRLLGSGGSSSVYLVERLAGSSTQQAALKVFTGLSTDLVFTRSFAREEFVLASLDHPSIPWLLDAGVSDAGEPFLVMEYAQGEQIDAFCDKHRLGNEERLRLMLRICEAVAYAHRNLVLHLDLKPSNILASVEEPRVKLLDFGTSRLLDTARTMTIAHMATPAYASPEQLRGETLTTGADVYALGAILFELLSGRRANPNRSAAIMIERSFLELPPDRLEDAVTELAAAARGTTESQLRRKLQGDLSTIVSKCMQPAAKDRYASVDALRDDLRRHLESRPIHARPQSTLYRLGKFVGRNRRQAWVAAIAAVCVIASLAYAVQHQRQEMVAAHRAIEMQQFMTRLFELAHSGATGKPAATVADMLQIGAQTLPSFITDPGDLRAARLSIGESMAADDDHGDSLPLLKNLIHEARDARDWNTLIEAEVVAGKQLVEMNQIPQGNPLLADALALTKAHPVSPRLYTRTVAWYVYGRDEMDLATPADFEMLKAAIRGSESDHEADGETATALNILGLGLQAKGKLDEAQAAYEHALAIYQRLPYSNCDQGDTAKYLAHLKKQRLDDAGALADFQRSYELTRSCAGEGALRTLSARAWVGNMLMQTHRYAETIALLEPALPLYYAAVGHDSPSLRLPLDALARSYTALGRYHDAEMAGREQLRVLAGKVPAKSSPISVANFDLGDALAHENRYPEAAAALQAAIDSYPMATPPTPLNLTYMKRMQDTLADAKAHVSTPDKRH